MQHRLDPVLRPQSLAIIGASQRVGSVGNTLVRQIRHGGYTGRLYPVNPRYEEIEGLTCYPSLSALPEVPQHVSFAVPNAAVEENLELSIAAGIRAGTMVSSLYLEGDREPPLTERIRQRCRETGFNLVGGNCMGYYNFEIGLRQCGFYTRKVHRAGGVTLLSHSGSALCSMVDAEARLDYNYVVSPGQELVLSLADYMDFALEQESTRVIAIFMETARDPAGFVAALEKAQRKHTPIVILKVGRTEESAKLATSHSGAMVGDDGAYQALFERYGVHRVRSIDELVYTALLFSRYPKLGPGGLAAIHDSGGERELFMDLAHDAGVPFAKIDEKTTARLAARLEHGLPPVNPCDAWGTGNDAQSIFNDCFQALMEDPDTALGVVLCDRGAEGVVNTMAATVGRQSRDAGIAKPIVFCSNHQGSGDSAETIPLQAEGFVTMDGAPQFLRAARALFDHRDFRGPGAGAALDKAKAESWRKRLTVEGTLDENPSLDLVADFGVPVIPRRLVETREQALLAAYAFGRPVVLKTAMPGIAHKSDVGGVKLNLSGDAVGAAYDDLAKRLGPLALVAPMAERGVEMILGLTRDAQFGPTVVIGSGGVLAEALKDVVLARPPFDAAWALKLIDRLKLRKLLDGFRGTPKADVEAFAQAAANLSTLAVALADRVKEIDINPVIVGPKGCMAVDALVVVG
jgi:acyl-CoA synthetase (NDP forming)